MTEVSTARLYVLRGMYAFMAVGLAVFNAPRLLFTTGNISLMTGVGWSILGAVGLLAILGIRYPLKMLPLLFFELAWKVIWVVIIWIPLWRAGTVDAAHAQTFVENMLGVVLIPIVLPWGYVVANYLRMPGDRWRVRPAS
jgi:hypothetical protein